MKDIKSINKYLFVAIVFLILPLSSAYGGSVFSNPTFSTILKSLKDNIPAVIQLTTAVGYALGIWFMISGVLDLKHIGQSQGSAQSGLGGPLMKIVVGIVLVYLPSTIDTGVITLWGASGITEYPINDTDPFGPAKQGAVALVQAIGYISFVSGLVTLAHSTGQGAQQGSVSKGFLHIIGGILAINIVATIQLIGNSVGIPMFS